MRLFAAARAAVGAGEVQVDPGSLTEVLQRVEEQAPAFAKVRPACSFLVDETAVHGDPSAIPVLDGQTVDVLPPFAGG